MDAPRRNNLQKPRGETRLRQAIGQSRPIKLIKRLPTQPRVTRRQHRELRGDHRVARILHLLIMRTVLKRFMRTHLHRVQTHLPDFIERGIGRTKFRRHLIRIRGVALLHCMQRERRRPHGDLQTHVAESPPMQGLENIRATRRLPRIAPTRYFTAAIEGPTSTFIGKMGSEIRERLLLTQQFRPRRAPRQTQGLRVIQPHPTARTTTDREMGKRCRQHPHIQHEIDFFARG